VLLHSFAVNFLLRLAFLPAGVFLLVRYFNRGRRLLEWTRPIEVVLVVAAAAVFTLRLTAPLAKQITDHVPWSIVDGDYIAYVQAWDVHALLRWPIHLFDANFFFPTKQALALSENHLGNMPIFAPLYLLTRNSILASNVVIMATFFLSATAMYLLVRCWLGDPWAAALAGFVYGFAPVRVYQMPRVHVINLQVIPLIVLSLLRFLRSGQWMYLLTFSSLMLLQVLCSMHAGVFAGLVVCAFLLAELVEGGNFWLRRTLAILAAMMLVGATLLPLLWPYWQWEKRGVLNTATPPTEVFSATPSSYLNGDSELYPGLLRRFRAPMGDYEKKLFFGFLPIAMSVVGMAAYLAQKSVFQSRVRSPTTEVELRNEGNRMASLALGAMLSIVLGFVLSLGPDLHLGSGMIHLPYYWLGRFLPGFHAVRSACRFGMIVLFGVAILTGLGFGAMLKAVAGRLPAFTSISAALTVAALFVVFWEFSVDLHTEAVPIRPAPEYRFLANQAPGTVTLELPTMSWKALSLIDFEPGASGVAPAFEREAEYVYASSFHWQPIMNGISGHVSPLSSEVLSLAVELPSQNAVSALAQYGLRLVIVHTAALSAEERAAWQSLPPSLGLIKVAAFDDVHVYEVRRSQGKRTLTSY
jgi:hypothetical protein